MADQSGIGVLTRRSAAIETLGSATVLCTDKTGTLTENRMAVAEIRTAAAIRGARPAMDGTQDRALLIGMLASQPEPYDPMEKAFHQSASSLADSPPAAALVRQYALSPDLLAMTNVWAQSDGSLLVAAKGAPEAIADLCHLDEPVRRAVEANVDELAARGMRVLGLAEATHRGSHPESQREFAFAFVGLVGLADPLRASVPQAVAECREAGIRVVMITGDYPATVIAIAHAAGLDAQRVLTGREVALISNEALATALRNVSVFARTQPQQKLRIVEALTGAGVGSLARPRHLGARAIADDRDADAEEDRPYDHGGALEGADIEGGGGPARPESTPRPRRSRSL